MLATESSKITRIFENEYVARRCISVNGVNAVIKLNLIVLFSFWFFLQLWVGVMISTQPFFIAGIEDAEKCKSSAFGAMVMFIVAFVLSIAGIYYDKANPKEEESPEMPEGYSLNAVPQTEYGSRFD